MTTVTWIAGGIALLMAVAMIGYGAPIIWRAVHSMWWYHRGRSFRQWNDLEAAERAWRRAVTASPLNLSARMALANVVAQRGEVDEAVALYEEAIKIKPRSARCFVRLGQVFAQAERFAEAKVALERAVELGVWQAHAMLGAICIDKDNDPESALDHYRQYLMRKPTDVDVIQAVARIERRMAEGSLDG